MSAIDLWRYFGYSARLFHQSQCCSAGSLRSLPRALQLLNPAEGVLDLLPLDSKLLWYSRGAGSRCVDSPGSSEGWRTELQLFRGSIGPSFLSAVAADAYAESRCAGACPVFCLSRRPRCFQGEILPRFPLAEAQTHPSTGLTSLCVDED